VSLARITRIGRFDWPIGKRVPLMANIYLVKTSRFIMTIKKTETIYSVELEGER
jgi:hypothetical protein